MIRQQTFWKATIIIALAPLPVGAWVFGSWLVGQWRGPSPMAISAARQPPAARVELVAGMVRIGGGEFVMGGAPATANDQLPAHHVCLDTFWLDQHPITNRQFAEFVERTGHRTSAERRGGSLVFETERGAWREVPEANWRQPEGPRSTLAGRDDFPVVHVSWDDAAAYANWAGKRLATEAEYEFAARGGLLDARYAWGDEPSTDDAPRANYWQGRFPTDDLGLDGFRSLAPVAQYPANRYGLLDMAGNVWCWCGDWYDAEYYVVSGTQNPSGPRAGGERVLRGGSWLSTGGDVDEMAVSARSHAPPGFSSNHVGFRCARNRHPELSSPPPATNR